MARIGKIARLSRSLRTQINTRLDDGNAGKQIVQWLNSLPEVKQVLTENFDGRPVNEQNLTHWRHGGYQEWLLCRDLLTDPNQPSPNPTQPA